MLTASHNLQRRREPGPEMPIRKPKTPGAATAVRRVAWTVRRSPLGPPHTGLLDTGGRVLPCILGRSGVATRKREGDGATPAGRLRVVGGWFRRDRTGPTVSCAGLRAIRPDDGWCDDAASPAYNRPISLPFRASHEKLHREDRLYDICLVLDWNLHPRARGRGSAIFLHVRRPDGGATEGCIALEPRLLRRLLPQLDGRAIRVVP